jgi:hypothetical protein
MNTKTTLDLTASDFSDDENDSYGSYDDKNTTHKNRDSAPFSNLIDSLEELQDGAFKMAPDSLYGEV